MLWEDSRKATEVGAGMSAGAWLQAGISGKVPLIPLVQFTP